MMNMEIGRSESSEGLGEFSLILPAGNVYRFSVTAPGYLPYSAEIRVPNTTQSSDTSITITLDSVGVGSVATIEDIYFDFNKATLKPESFFSLDGLADLLRKNTKWVVRIEGYTDSIGTIEFNKQLSLERAQSVVQYLVSKHIDMGRLEAVGFGPENPIADNDTEEGRQKNRRVQFRIVKFTSEDR
jgi:outer membrane protein OmpA-like peptidoglycan-associated protein